MTCLTAPPAPSKQAVGPDASEVVVASCAPASSAESHCTVTVDVASAGLHEAPLGRVPSVTETVATTGPDAVHVKLVDAPVAAENVPLGADQAYARAPALGPVAVAVRFTVLPTVVSEGLAETPEATAQLYVWAPIAAEPASGAGEPHCMRTVTLVVCRLVTEKLADPAQVTVPSTVVPEIETL
jgi:hypothetical protein